MCAVFRARKECLIPRENADVTVDKFVSLLGFCFENEAMDLQMKAN